MCLVLVMLALAVFAPVRHFAFVAWDDPGYVTDNAIVKQGLTVQGVSWALTNPGHFYWHPLSWLSHMADVEMFGLEAGAHHVTNLVLHVTGTLLLFFVFRRMTGHVYRSAFAAALFAVHPLRVESVAWVAERKDVLSGVFLMLTLWAYARYTERRSAARYALVVVAFSFGLMSKPTLVMVPVVLLLLDHWPLRRSGLGVRRLVVEKLPLFALSLAASVATLLTQLQVEAVSTLETVTAGERLSNAAAATVTYVGMAAWPHRLAAFYPFRPIAGWWAGCCVAVIAAVSTGAVRARLSRPYLTFGWFWYVVMLIPVIGLVQVGSQSMADRFTYLPMVGLFVAFAWTADDVLTRFAAPRWMAAAGAGAIVAACALASDQQVRYWKNSETLWRRAVEVVPNNDLAHANLARVLSEDGRSGEALTHYTEALRIVGDHDAATGTGRGDPPTGYAFLLHNSRGLLLARMQRFPEAIADLREALRLHPESADGHYALGMALASAGLVDEAVGEARRAVQLDPARADFRADLASVLYRRGDLAGGISELVEAIRIGPSHASAARWHYNLAAMLNSSGRQEDATRELRLALAIDPGYEAASRALSSLLKQPH